MALSAICSFAVPVYELGVSIRLLSYLLLTASSFLGIFGYLGGIMVIFSYLLSLRSFGEPFLAPMFPYYKGEMKKIFIRQPFWKIKLRPKMADSKDPQMQSSKDMKPRPPSNEANSNW
jgi:spore germination protein KA